MKLLLLLILTVVGVSNLKAQALYVPGKVVKGKYVSYYCEEFNNLALKVRNTQNVDTTNTMYFDNGEIVPVDWFYTPGKPDYEQKDLIQVFKNVFTAEEWEKIKNTRAFIQIIIVMDKAGRAIEVEFTFFKKDPVLPKLTPDRLFQLEQNLKKILKMNLAKENRNIRNIKYFESIEYKDLKDF